MNTTESKEQMEVKVCLVEHKKVQVFVTEITNDETVEALKARLTEHVGPVENQTLIYGGVELEDRQLLSKYNILSSDVPIVLRMASPTPPIPISLDSTAHIVHHEHRHRHEHFEMRNGMWQRVEMPKWLSKD